MGISSFGSALATFFSSSTGTALAAGAASAGIGAGVNALLAKHSGISIPPPPGAAMIDPTGSAAAASLRQRQAVAGGLNSTVSGAGNTPAPAGPNSDTAGGKSLLGQ